MFGIDGYNLIVIIELNDVDQSLRSSSVDDVNRGLEIISASVRKKPTDPMLDFLQRATKEQKALIFLLWFRKLAEIEKVATTPDHKDDIQNTFLPDFADAIPLQDRESALDSIKSFCERRYLHYRSETKQDHAFLTLLSPRGCGKTRLSREALKIFEEMANNEVIYLLTCSP